MENGLNALLVGQEVIRRYVKDMAGSPGVYRMLDAKGEALYIGKANNLRQRVSSYLNLRALNLRMQYVVAQTAAMELTLTRSEAEALLLEASLVRKLLPRYNILLKDDKSFPYIFFSGDHSFSRIGKHRGPKTAKGRYFGPFTSGLAVNETLSLLQRAFLLRPCSDNVFKGRTRPCLQYQIKRCSAPCVGKISEADYRALADQAQAFLSGKSRQIQDQLLAEMQELSLKMDYEKAALLRDRLRALAQVQQQGGLDLEIGDADIFALAREGSQCCVQMLSFRGGHHYGAHSWFPAHTASYRDGEILSAAVGRIYQTQPPPALILTSHLLEDAALLEEALKLQSGRKVEIAHPLRGTKRGLIEQAAANAKEALAMQLTTGTGQKKTAEAIQACFGLDEPPGRIEVYDNSHIGGTHAVGAMIVAGPEGFRKNEYRKFNIKREDIAPGDDYAMLREVLTRRFHRMQEEDGKTPDLVLIDGGAGQLAVAVQVFEELGVQGVALAAIAKGPDRNAGREWLHQPGREPFQLPEHDVALHALQRLRDEAHRFAIGAHRARRSKVMKTSRLDAIPAIGRRRKRALLHHFGSPRAVAAAGLAEIEKVPGISKATARTIYGHFHGE